MHRIPLHNKYKKYLKTLSDISNIQVLNDKTVQCNINIGNESYTIIFYFNCDRTLPKVVLCNPKNKQFPHTDFINKNELLMCLSSREDISVINKNYIHLIDYTLARVIKLLTLNEKEIHREYRKEFLYFWNKKCCKEEQEVKVLIESKKVSKLMIYKKAKSYVFTEGYCNEMFIKDYNKDREIALFIPLVNTGDILPPLDYKSWNTETIRKIFFECISEDNVEILEQIMVSNGIYIVFEMEIPNVLTVSFLVKLQFKGKKVSSIFDLVEEDFTIHYRRCQRYDTQYLNSRVGIHQDLSTKKILIIGAGSLGSYIIAEIPKLGVQNIDIVDDDYMSIDNLLRHRLGYIYNSVNKAKSMANELQYSYPQVKVKSFDLRIQNSNLDKVNFEQYDLVIIATGGTDFMLMLNEYFHNITCNTPILYTWIEPDGVGVHGLIVDNKKSGCFECLYTNSVRNKAHIIKEETKSRLTGTGCGGVFNAYGNIVLLKGAAMIIEVISELLSTGYKENLLFSVKTNSKYINEDFDKIQHQRKLGSAFYIDKECGVCVN